MTKRSRVKWAFGFDPGINEAAWAAVNTEGQVLCGLIRNTYKPNGPIKHWEKLKEMLELLQDELDTKVLGSLPKVEAWVTEGQYCTRRGNQEHNVRLGWVSALAFTMGHKRAERVIALPQSWTRGRPKELRHPELLEGLVPENEWKWIGKPAPPSLLNHVYDAVGMAVWGLSRLDIKG